MPSGPRLSLSCGQAWDTNGISIHQGGSPGWKTVTQIESAHVYVFNSVLAVFRDAFSSRLEVMGVDGIQCANSRPIRLSAQLQHTENEHIQRKELALPPGSKEYYNIIRTGVCNAYLAASVVGSSLVGTCKTGGMSMVSAE